jgi:phosphate transport system substrate-binding protein
MQRIGGKMRKVLGTIIILVATFLLTCYATKTTETKENNIVKDSNSNKDRSPIEDTKSTEDNKFGIKDNNYPKIDGSTSTFSIVREIFKVMYDGKENVSYPEAPSKTVPSYKKLINGEVDMIFVPYASPEVLKLAESKGVELEFHPVATEALVFITPAENKVKNITMDQARKIYLQYGIKNWSELGGTDRKLIPICRNADSGSQSQMDNLVLQDKKMHSSIKKNYVQLTMEGMLELTAFYHNGGMDGKATNSYALGYTLYTYLKQESEITGIDKRLKMLAFEGVAPTEKTIADGSYPLIDGYYAVVRSNLPKGHSARNIINWLQNGEGNAIIRKFGFIPAN